MSDQKEKLAGECLDTYQIAEFIQGISSHKETQKIKEHLRVCQYCQSLVATIEDVTAQQIQDELFSIPIKHTQKAKDLFVGMDGTLVWDLIVGCTQKVLTELKTNGEILAGLKTMGGLVLRGDKKLGAQVVLIEKIFLKTKIQAEVSVSNNGYALRIIAGLVQQNTPANLRATLCVHSEELESYMLTNGTAVYEGLAFGDYEILFSQNNVLLGKMNFSLREL